MRTLPSRFGARSRSQIAWTSSAPSPRVSWWIVVDPNRPVERHAPLRQRRGQQPTSTVSVHGQVEPAFHLPLRQSGRQHHLVDRGGVGLRSQHARRHAPTDTTRQVVGHPHLLADGLPQPAQRREPLEVGPCLDPLYRLEDLQLLLHPLL